MITFKKYEDLECSVSLRLMVLNYARELGLDCPTLETNTRRCLQDVINACGEIAPVAHDTLAQETPSER